MRELFARVIDNAKVYARAEINVVKQTVSTRTGQAGPAIGLFVVALLLVQAALTVLTAALGACIASWLGWPAGLAIGGVIVLLLAGLLAWIGYRRITGVFK